MATAYLYLSYARMGLMMGEIRHQLATLDAECWILWGVQYNTCPPIIRTDARQEVM